VLVKFKDTFLSELFAPIRDNKIIFLVLLFILTCFFYFFSHSKINKKIGIIEFQSARYYDYESTRSFQNVLLVDEILSDLDNHKINDKLNQDIDFLGSSLYNSRNIIYKLSSPSEKLLETRLKEIYLYFNNKQRKFLEERKRYLDFQIFHLNNEYTTLKKTEKIIKEYLDKVSKDFLNSKIRNNLDSKSKIIRYDIHIANVFLIWNKALDQIKKLELRLSELEAVKPIDIEDIKISYLKIHENKFANLLHRLIYSIFFGIIFASLLTVIIKSKP